MGLIWGILPQWAEVFYGDGSGYGDGDGYGYGSGYGYGDGSGDGDGSGSGYGDGSGSGSGYGYGYGYGSGDGSGYGDGYGSGYGDGYGSGDGSGDGYGSGSWRLIAARFAAKWEGSSGFIAFWKSDKDGHAANGGTSRSPVVPGMTQTCEGPLKICTARALHATLNPDKWKGERLWIVALKGEVHIQDDKIGALEREIICEVK